VTRRAIAVLLLLGATTEGCARDANLVRWERKLYEAEAAFSLGRFAESRAMVEEILPGARRPTDADEAKLKVCSTHFSERAFRPSLQCYERLAAATRDREVRSRAVFHMGEVLYDHLGDKRGALELFIGLVDRAHDTKASLRAMDYLLIYGQEGPSQRQEVLRFFDARWPGMRWTELGDNLLLNSAALLAEGGSRAELLEACRRLDVLERDYSHGALIVWALWDRATYHRRLDDPDAEIRDIEHLISTRESSHIFASYDWPRFRIALVRAVELLRDVRVDLSRAERYAGWLLTTFRRPLERYNYHVLLATVLERKGDLAGARAQYQAVVDYDRKERSLDVESDDRICGEIDGELERAKCRAECAQRVPFEASAVSKARAELRRLGAVSPR